MARVRLELNLPPLLVSDDMQDAMVQAAEAGKSHAESISPVDSGEYRSKFEVEPATFTTSEGGTRKGAILSNTALHAAAVEWGRGHHVLGQTVGFLESE